MMEALTPKQLAELTGISRSYSSQILSGSRPCPPEIALSAFRAFGVRLGLLAEMTDGDIAKLVAQQLAPAAECQGADACASVGDGSDHASSFTSPPPPLSTGQADEMSPDLRQEGIAA